MATILTMRHLWSLHQLSSQHERLLAMTKECSCFYCCKKFKTSQIKEWIPCLSHKSAMCPLCWTDSVLPLVLPQKVLLQMSKYWFGTDSTSDEIRARCRTRLKAMSKLSRQEKMALGLIFEDE